MELKVFFAERLIESLRGQDFQTIAWAGDGGLFALDCHDVDDYDNLVNAADIVFETLGETLFRYSVFLPPDGTVAVRVSAHVGEIYVIDAPHFWHGEELNFFAKHERELSQSGMFSITEAVRKNLSHMKQREFPPERSALRIIDNRRVFLYFSTKHKPAVTGSTAIMKIERPSDVPWIHKIVQTDYHHGSFSIGSCIVFDQALTADGYVTSDLKITKAGSDLPLPEPLEQIVEEYLADQIGKKLPHYHIGYFKHPETDFPLVHIGLDRTWYHQVRAIQAALQMAPEKKLHVESQEMTLIDYMCSLNPLNFDRNLCPANFAVHLAIVTSDGARGEGPRLVLVQRGPSKQVGYYPGAWSVTIQETMLADGAVEDDQVRRGSDMDIIDCAARGLEEELMGERLQRDQFSLHCFFVEGDIFGQACFGIVHVPVSFEELCHRRRRVAPDSRESSQLASLPLRPETLLRLFDGIDVDRQVLKEIAVTDPDGSRDRLEVMQGWHPSSRLALFMLMRRYFPDAARKVALEEASRR